MKRSNLKISSHISTHDRDDGQLSEIFVSDKSGTICGNAHAKFEVRTFSHFGAITI